MLSSVLLFKQVIGGELVAEDIVGARKALDSLLHDEANHYRFEAAMSGCMFDSCSTARVRFYRHAAFSAEAGSENALVARRKVIRCFSWTDVQDWRCLSGVRIIAKMVGLEETAIELSPEIGDELAIALVKFIRSECFVTQLNDYDQLGTKVPDWARTDFRITGIEKKNEKFYVSVPFSKPIGYGQYELETANEPSSCAFSLVRFWFRH